MLYEEYSLITEVPILIFPAVYDFHKIWKSLQVYDSSKSIPVMVFASLQLLFMLCE